MTDAIVGSQILPAPTSVLRSTVAPWFARIAPTAAVSVGVFLLLVLLSSELLNDPDTQWHVATGRWIWSHRSFPTVDVFSHTFAGAPWIAKEWLSQLVLFAAYACAGWKGVALAIAAVLAATYGLLFRWLAQRLRTSVALAATLVALALAAPHLLARPHVLVLPIVVLWVTQLVTALERRSAPPLPLALAMVAWTNMHGSFPLGIVLASLAAAEGFLLRAPGSRIAALRGWALFLAASVGATLITPYGWTVILIPLKIGGNAAMPFLSEWQPLTLDGNGCLAIGLLALSLLALASRLRANIFRLVALLAIGAMMVRHSRFVDLFGIVDPILVAGSVAMYRPLAADRDVQRVSTLTSPALAAVALLGATAAVAAVMVTPQPNPNMTPNAALHAALSSGVTGPVYNDYDFGGFLIDHDVKTFVDGRSDQLFLGDFLPSLQRALNGKDNSAFAAILARYGARWALVRRGSADAAHVAALPGWSKLYEDRIAAVYAAPSEP